MNGYLIKAICFDGQIRAMALRTTETISEAQKRHDTWSASTAALGRTMTGSLMLAAMLKNDETVTVKIQGDGPGGAIIVDANANGHVKGYIQRPHVSLPLNANGKIDVCGVVGTTGSLTVIKDLGLKEPFTGQVPLVSGELAEDFTYYLANSEQVPSAVGLSVLTDEENVKAAGGFMIQVMPGATDETISIIEERLQHIPLVSSLLDAGETPENILDRLLGAENVTVLDKSPVSFHCDCSKERFAKALVSVGQTELQAMIDEDGGAEAVCHFCNQAYQYTIDDLTAMILVVEGKK